MPNTEFKTGVIRPIEVYKEAWELIKDQYWLILAITTIGLIMGSVVPIVLIGPMLCGIYICLFDKYEGRRVEFGEIFKGFEFFLPSLILAVIIFIPFFIMLVGFYIPVIIMALTGLGMNDEELFAFIAGTFVVELIFAVIMVCLHTLLMFSFPLIVDKKLSAWESVKLSARAVWKNMSGVVGLFAVGFVAALIGYMLFCVGIYFVFPIIFAANVIAYKKIFPSTENSNFYPPPPNAFQGAGDYN